MLISILGQAFYAFHSFSHPVGNEANETILL